MFSFHDHEKPSVLVMVRVFEVIASYLNKKPEEMLQHHIFDCKRLNNRIKPMRIGILKKKIEYLENNLKSDEPRLMIQNLKKDILILENSKKENEELLLEFLIPPKKTFEVNELNKSKLIAHYLKKIKTMNPEKLTNHFYDFLFRKDNFFKYKKLFNFTNLENFYYSKSIATPYINKLKLALEKYSK